jgi:L-asparaginase II
MNAGEVLLEVVRSEMVESVHSGHVLILGADGEEVLKIGDIDQLIYPRSAVKSLQAQPWCVPA